MKRWLRNVMVNSLVATSMAAGVGCLHVSAAELKIGILPIMEMAPLVYAIDAGFFKKEGIDVRTVVFQSGGPLQAAMLSGSVDMQFRTGGAALIMIEKGQDVRSIAHLVNRTRLEIVARNEVPIKLGGIKDLRGKKIGIASLGGGVHDILNYVLFEAGMTPADVTTLPLGAGAPLLANLQQGTVDFMADNEPFITQAVVIQHFAKRVLDVGVDGPGRSKEISGVVLQATASWINANRETVAGTIRAIGNAHAAMRADLDKVAKILKPRFDAIDEASLKLILERQARFWHTAITPANVDADNAMLLVLKQTSKAIPYEKAVVDKDLRALWK